MSKTSGMSFAELLLSLFICSYCLIGLSHLYLATVSQTTNNFLLRCAIQQINSLIQRINIDPNHIDAEFHEWNVENAKLLPGGVGTISGNNPFVIGLGWYDKTQQRKIFLSQKIEKDLHILGRDFVEGDHFASAQDDNTL